MKRAFTIFAACLAWAGANAQSLIIKVCDIEKQEGYVYGAVYSSAETFLAKPLTGFRVEAKGGELLIPCTGLPCGKYAISLFHDLNGNGQLDTGAFGIPTEPFGFSNNAPVEMGPPKFEKCCFTLQGDTTIVVNMR